MRKLNKDMKPWDWTKILNEKLITLNEIKEDYENNLIFEKQFNPYIILLSYSNSPHYNIICNYINEYMVENPSNEFMFKYLYHAIPKNNYFIKWNKKQKQAIENKLILDENTWNSAFPDYPFNKIKPELMKYIQEEEKDLMKILKKELK